MQQRHFKVRFDFLVGHFVKSTTTVLNTQPNLLVVASNPTDKASIALALDPY